MAKLEKDIYVSLQGFRAERKEDKIIGPEKMRDNDVPQCGIITRRFEERGKFLDVDFSKSGESGCPCSVPLPI